MDRWLYQGTVGGDPAWHGPVPAKSCPHSVLPSLRPASAGFIAPAEPAGPQHAACSISLRYIRGCTDAPSQAAVHAALQPLSSFRSGPNSGGTPGDTAQRPGEGRRPVNKISARRRCSSRLDRDVSVGRFSPHFHNFTLTCALHRDRCLLVLSSLCSTHLQRGAADLRSTAAYSSPRPCGHCKSVSKNFPVSRRTTGPCHSFSYKAEF